MKMLTAPPREDVLHLPRKVLTALLREDAQVELPWPKPSAKARSAKPRLTVWPKLNLRLKLRPTPKPKPTPRPTLKPESRLMLSQRLRDSQETRCKLPSLAKPHPKIS